jgi:hypothetical protein
MTRAKQGLTRLPPAPFTALFRAAQRQTAFRRLAALLRDRQRPVPPLSPSRMLASPLMPTSAPSHSSEDQYRPSRDLDAFNKLLPPPIEFVEGSSSGTLAVAEGKYEPINVSPKTPNAEVSAPPPSPVTHLRSIAHIAHSFLKGQKYSIPSRMARPARQAPRATPSHRFMKAASIPLGPRRVAAAPD